MFKAAGHESEYAGEVIVVAPEVVIQEIRKTGKDLADALPDDIAQDIESEIDKAEEVLQRKDTPRSGGARIKQKVQELANVVAEIRPLQADVDQAQQELDKHLALEEPLRKRATEQLYYPSRDVFIDAYEEKLSEIVGKGSRRDVHNVIKETDEYRKAVYKESGFVSALDSNELLELGRQAKGNTAELQRLIAARIAARGGQRALEIATEVQRGNVAVEEVIDGAIDRAGQVRPTGDAESLRKLAEGVKDGIKGAIQQRAETIYDPLSGDWKKLDDICRDIEKLGDGYRVSTSNQEQANVAAQLRRAIQEFDEARNDEQRIQALRQIENARRGIDNITDTYNRNVSQQQKERFRALEKQLQKYDAKRIISDYDKYKVARDNYYLGLQNLNQRDSASQVVRELADQNGRSLRGVLSDLEEANSSGNILSADEIARARSYYQQVKDVPDMLAGYKKARREASEQFIENIEQHVLADSPYVIELARLAQQLVNKEEYGRQLNQLTPVRNRLRKNVEDLKSQRELAINEKREVIGKAIQSLQDTVKEVEEQSNNVRAFRLQASNMVLVEDPETGLMVEKPMPLLLTAGEAKEDRDRKVATAEQVVYGKAAELFPPGKIVTEQDLPAMLQALEDINAQFPWLEQIRQSENGKGEIEDTPQNRLVAYYWQLRNYIASQEAQANLRLENERLQERVSNLSEQVQYQIGQRQAMVNAYMELDEQRRKSIEALNDELDNYRVQLDQTNLSLAEKQREEERLLQLLRDKEALITRTQERLENAELTAAGLQNVVTVIEQLPTVLSMQYARNNIVGKQLVVPVLKSGEGNTVVIGRTAMDVSNEYNKGISRTHFRVSSNGRGFTVQDLGSSNGTYLNGERVNEEQQIRPGDIIRIGAVENPVYYLVTPNAGGIELVYIDKEQVAAIDNLMESDDNKAKSNALRVIRQNARLYNDFYEEQQEAGILEDLLERERDRLLEARQAVNEAIVELNDVNVFNIQTRIKSALGRLGRLFSRGGAFSSN